MCWGTFAASPSPLYPWTAAPTHLQLSLNSPSLLLLPHLPLASFQTWRCAAVGMRSVRKVVQKVSDAYAFGLWGDESVAFPACFRVMHSQQPIMTAASQKEAREVEICVPICPPESFHNLAFIHQFYSQMNRIQSLTQQTKEVNKKELRGIANYWSATGIKERIMVLLN